jgi:hypothetical protein
VRLKISLYLFVFCLLSSSLVVVSGKKKTFEFSPLGEDDVFSRERARKRRVLSLLYRIVIVRDLGSISEE